MIQQDLVNQARSIDILSLTRERFPLQKESTREWSGPCPKCGGEDRFHVTPTGFFCRQCHPDFGDAIEYMFWMHRLSFSDAVHMLTNQTAPLPDIKPQPIVKPAQQPTQPPGWQTKALAVVDTAKERLDLALPYLASRGLTPETAIIYGLGYRPDAPLPGTWNGKRFIVAPQPAVVIPWYRAGQLVAVRYRFLKLHEYKDAEGRERKVKQSSVFHSDFSGLLYGGHVLPAFCAQPTTANPIERKRVLVACEGEINAMSIHQIAHTWRWDVLSLGSESQKLTDGGRKFAERYGRVIVWMDKPEIAQTLTRQIPGSVAVSSPEIEGRQMDANAMLQSNNLESFLLTARERCLSDQAEAEDLMWNLWEAWYANS